MPWVLGVYFLTLVMLFKSKFKGMKVFYCICHREAGPARCLRYLGLSQVALTMPGFRLMH